SRGVPPIWIWALRAVSNDGLLHSLILKKSLFQHSADAKVLSKFDLKSGFWQLGIKPEDRPQTAFCIPDHHYRWKVMSFGLKNAPSAFQKAMITIFEPILANTLVYIDDILLFSPDEQSHAELLSKFYSRITKYGIMLSEKKMEVGVITIQFLGMEISDGKYQPQPHVAQELLKFPDELSSQKMIQQFLGQTEAVKTIKSLAEKMPPLKIPASSEKRILQTDASDECWGAVLLVHNNNNKRHVCEYKSGTFKASEKHYYSTFKEILAVKRGIEKFQFHLIGHEFQVEMDMSSFPRMLQFKKKMLPHAQLLRWSNWFSQWKFTVKHIKGTENVLADFLSRPKAYKLEENYPKDASRVQNHTPHFLSMVFSVASYKKEGSSSNTTPTVPVFYLPEEIHLADAKVLSKFDLLSGFWQLGIKPEDRLKTAFCIPDHHYQWKVMPFGLKNAPSAFQKAMITIFEPILANTLVYIDDILLFSPDEQSHAELLSKFYSLVTKYRIMLSKKKMEVEVTTIQFLGLEISDGRYQPQPHVAQELLKFPDELSSQKMIQQFLGLVNYMADFLPKLSHHTVWLFPMLKKNPPQWTSRQTEAVKAIKSLAEKMPPLKIPASSEKRILQTDASDECWG
nr:putative reverse transcriptase domain, viral movement protein [Tanacetum cinerariifolium]